MINNSTSLIDANRPGLFAKDNAGKLAVTSFCLSFINIDIYLIYRLRLINLESCCIKYRSPRNRTI